MLHEYVPDEAGRELIERYRGLHTDARTSRNAAPCRWCGVGVESEGAQYVGTWRVCGRCREVTTAEMLGRVLRRRDVTYADVVAVGVPGAEFMGASPTGRPGTKPWAHVDKAMRADLNRQMDTARAERTAKVNDTGRGCGWCGVATSRTWERFKATWPDGVVVQLCSACADLYDLAGRPMDGWRERAAFVAAGGKRGRYRPGEDFGWRAFSEVATEDRSGTAQPWQYLPQKWLEDAQVRAFGLSSAGARDPEVGRWARGQVRAMKAAADREAEQARSERQARQQAEDAAIWG